MEDTLSEIFRRIRLTGCVYFQRDFHAPWAMHIEGTGFAQFHVVTRGDCVVQVAGRSHDLNMGDVLLFPHGYAHVLADQAGRAAVPGGEVMASFAGPKPYFETGGRATRLICGHYEYRDRIDHPAIEQLPEFILVRSFEFSSTDTIRTVITLLMQELADGAPGSNSVAERLAEVLLVQIIRAHFSQSAVPSGFFAGLTDHRLARAIQRIHAEATTDLKLDDLAQVAGMSRSSFAQTFKTVIGLSPIEYLSKWRMLLASDMLEGANRSIADVATSIGYESEISFSRAFKREFLVTPAVYRRRHKPET